MHGQPHIRSSIRVHNLTPDLLNTKHGVVSVAMSVRNTAVVLVLKSERLATQYDLSSDPVTTATDFSFYVRWCVSFPQECSTAFSHMPMRDPASVMACRANSASSSV